MKALILAAGLGSRLKNSTKDIPKALVEVNSKPIIEYQIDEKQNRLSPKSVSEFADELS